MTIGVNIKGEGDFFANDRLLKRVLGFQNEIEEDLTKYQAGVLIALAAEYTTYGLSELDRLAKALKSKHFGTDEEPSIFVNLLERYKGLWTQHIAKAFATARSSVPGRTQFKQRTILQRLFDVLTFRRAEQSEAGLFSDGKRAYSVKTLFNKTDTEVTTNVKMSAFTSIFDQRLWSMEVPGERRRRVSINEVLSMIADGTYPENDTQDHKRRLEEADLSFPIILREWNDQHSLVDGAHRLAKARKLNRKTIKVRILEGGIPVQALLVPVPSKEAMTPRLDAVVRTSSQRHIYRMGLATYLKMITRTLPMNFRRDYEQLLVRYALRVLTGKDKPSTQNQSLYLINTGHSNTSCTTCLALNGRVLTRPALDMATTMLSPPLFHPNCRHAVLPSLVATENSYNGAHGEIVTVATLDGLIVAGKLKRAKRPSPRTVNV